MELTRRSINYFDERTSAVFSSKIERRQLLPYFVTVRNGNAQAIQIMLQEGMRKYYGQDFLMRISFIVRIKK